MKGCPKCGRTHIKKGTYCSRSCANSRVWTEEQKAQKRAAFHASPKKANSLANLVKHRSPENIDKWRAAVTRANKSHSKRMRVSATMRRPETESKRLYRRMCRFTFALKNYPNEFDFDLIRKYGWFRTKGKKTNVDGVSRDHMLSINDGFEQGILPQWLAHPANCRLLPHKENQAKWGRSVITLDDLRARIAAWEFKYGPYYK